MEAMIRQSVGIDIASEKFTACFCTLYSTGRVELSEVLEFENAKPGFNKLLKWVGKQTSTKAAVNFAMEATGIYYEALAYHLHKLDLRVAVVLPNRVKYFAHSLNVKSKTDLIDARVIARMAAERNMELWEPPAPVIKQLRDLTRLYTDLKYQQTAFKNRLHSIEAGNEPLKFIVESTESIIKKLEKEIEKCKEQIALLIASEPWLAEKVKKLTTIKGVKITTIAIIIAETQAFKLIRNSKQLVSYAGYDVVENQSGTSVRGKTRISKKGNGRIRAALYLPSVVAATFNKPMKTMYERLNKTKPNKKISLTAVQRKLLVLMFSMWKSDTVFDENRQTVSLPAQDDHKDLLH